MPQLQATWLPEGRLFFWSRDGRVDRAVRAEIPGLAALGLETEARRLVDPGPPVRRRIVRGLPLEIGAALAPLTQIDKVGRVSPSVRCWAQAALLGLELAAAERVVPTVRDGRARWRALLSRGEDQARFEAIAASLPAASRAAPTRDRGTVRILTGDAALRGFLDDVVDGVFRRDAWPGSGRGWVLEFAEALKGSSDGFTPREARSQGIPDLLANWSSQADTAGLRLGMRLHLPDARGAFRLSFEVEGRDGGVPVRDAWRSGAALTIGGERHPHPAHFVLVALARASRLFPPLAQALRGAEPRDIEWNADRAWHFLSEGVELLREAGFGVRIPEEFARGGGKQRIRARMRIGEPERVQGRIDLQSLLRFRWEVVLGDMVLDGADFADLLSKRAPIVQFRGDWVVLDPAELARLPEGLPHEGTLPAAEALRAVLVGEHQGIPVVADDQLGLTLEALRNPPPRPLPAGLRGTLRPYQKAGFDWLATLGDLGLGACLADDMGLGKTVQLIVHLLDRRKRVVPRLPSLVVCPTSVLGNWGRELGRFAPSLRVLRYHGGDRAADFGDVDVVLTTYGLLVRDREILAERDWDVVALDEAQYIKNPESRRARSAGCLTARQRIALTGTPVENRLDELWSLISFLIPGLLGTRGAFQRTFAVPIERFGDDEAARALKQGVAPFLLRRVKTDPRIIDDLPEKFEHRLYCSLTAEQAALYERVVDKHMGRIEGAADIERRGHILAMLTALKQVCNHPAHFLKEEGPLEGRSGKVERVADLVDTIVSELGERLLLFTQYREMGVLLQRFFEPWWGEIPFLHGGTPTARRDEMVDAFQQDPDAAPMLIVSLRAGGTGLNLTRATHVLHFDRWWNPAVEDQATDRAYRIGQNSDVQVHKLVCQGTLEERIDALLEEKRALAASVIGGERWVTELDDRALRALVALGEDAVTEAWD